MSKFSLRPLQKSSDFRDIYKIFVPPRLFVSLRSSVSASANIWFLEDSAGNSVAVGKLAQAQEEVQNKVLQVSQEFKDLFGLSFSETYTLRKSDDTRQDNAKPDNARTDGARTDGARSGNGKLGNASEIVLQPQTRIEEKTRQIWWEGWMAATLVDKMISPGLLINVIGFHGEAQSFRVETVRLSDTAEALRTPLDICIPTAHTEIRFKDPDDEEGKESNFTVDRKGLFGMDQQLDVLDKMLLSHDPGKPFPAHFAKNGLLLLGPQGSDKKLLAKRIAKLPWRKKVAITRENLGSSPGKTLTQVFSDCLKSQPALIMVERFDNLRKILGFPFESALSEAFEIIEKARVLVLVGAKSDEMSEDLLDCFLRRISLPSIDQDSRRQIITHILNIDEANVQVPAQLPAIMAEETPGYTSLDLHNLVEDTLFNAYARAEIKGDLELATTDAHPNAATDADSKVATDEHQIYRNLEVTLEDFEQAKNLTPVTGLAKASTASRRVVRWSDIGGQEETKNTVEMHFEWPLRYPEKFRVLNLEPSKGMLLYGPPGCSKTMTALALATEAKLNFIPIKGPELLTKYLGDSESKLRDIFQKARSMAPCVIFFDEIDSINSSGESGGGVKLVETLLNELDGVDSIGNVFVLAATNKPWELDKALLRSGRFDTLLYVRLPDARARKEIFRIQIRGSPEETIDLDRLVEITEGCSGAEIVGFCRHAKLLALKEQIRLPNVEFAGKHFNMALSGLRKDTSAETIAEYEAFERTTGG